MLQETYQIGYNASDPIDAPTIVDSSSPYVSGGGLIHVVSGLGGHDQPRYIIRFTYTTRIPSISIK